MGTIMHLIQGLDTEELDLIVKCLEKCEWQNGKGSALGRAKDKKVNAQAYADQEAFEPINKILEQLVFKKLKHYVFASRLVGVRAAVYLGEQEGKYDWHVDYSHMNGCRTDISFTLFLSDMSKYEGGELDIEARGLNYAVKGKSGEIVLYGTGDRHRVRPVTSGTRLVIVGWISSLIPNLEDRDLLIDYWNNMQLIDKLEVENVREIMEKMNENYMRLMRVMSK